MFVSTLKREDLAHILNTCLYRWSYAFPGWKHYSLGQVRSCNSLLYIAEVIEYFEID